MEEREDEAISVPERRRVPSQRNGETKCTATGREFETRPLCNFRMYSSRRSFPTADKKFDIVGQGSRQARVLEVGRLSRPRSQFVLFLVVLCCIGIVGCTTCKEVCVSRFRAGKPIGSHNFRKTSCVRASARLLPCTCVRLRESSFRFVRILVFCVRILVVSRAYLIIHLRAYSRRFGCVFDNLIPCVFSRVRVRTRCIFACIIL